MLALENSLLKTVQVKDIIAFYCSWGFFSVFFLSNQPIAFYNLLALIIEMQ